MYLTPQNGMLYAFYHNVLKWKKIISKQYKEETIHDAQTRNASGTELTPCWRESCAVPGDRTLPRGAPGPTEHGGFRGASSHQKAQRDARRLSSSFPPRVTAGWARQAAARPCGAPTQEGRRTVDQVGVEEELTRELTEKGLHEAWALAPERSCSEGHHPKRNRRYGLVRV